MNRIYEIRTRLMMTQSQLSKELGITSMAVSHYEIGRNDPPFQVLKKLKAFLLTKGIVMSYDEMRN